MIKKSVKFILGTVFLLFIQILSAQVTISIPVGNSHNTGLTYAQMRKPLGTFFGYERSAMLFKHNEIGQYGQINSIAFFCDTSIHSPGNTPVVIYMKERTDSVFLSASDVATEETGAQMVYNGII